jgi:hypothetical protein
MNTAIKNIISKIENDTRQSYTYNEVLEMLNDELNYEDIYTKDDLETAWKSSEQNMRFQFSSSAYKGILFEHWFISFKDLKNSLSNKQI